MSSRLDVVVGICTYRRPAQLARLLRALADQHLPQELVPLQIIVVDNSPGGEGEAVAAAATGLAVRYVPLGARNISVARNRVLAEGRDARLLALLDDDEWPEPDWLAALLHRQRETGADIVVGPVRPVFPPDAPNWLRATGAFGVADLESLARLREGITGNVLLSCATVQRLGLTFDDQLGLSGGEDQLFFRQALAGGAAMAYAPDAVASEDVPAERVRASYVLRGEYRRGNTLGLLDRGRPGWPAGRPARRTVVALWWAVSGVLRLLPAAVRRDRTRVLLALGRAVRAAGMLGGLIGRRYDLYAASPEPAGLDAAA